MGNMKLKTILITVVIIVLAGSFASALAQNTNEEKSAEILEPKIKISIGTNNLIVVRYQDTMNERRQKKVVRIFDEFGYLVFHSHLKQKGNARVRYDISQFPDGNYTFKVFEKYKLICSKNIAKQTQVQTKVYDCSLTLQEN
jgi:hypothetical protein